MNANDVGNGSAGQRVRWTYEELDKLVRECAARLVDAGFTQDNWQPTLYGDKDQIEGIFQAAQVATLEPHRIKRWRESSMGFESRYFTLIPRIGPAVFMLIAERKAIAARAGTSVESAMTSQTQPKPETPPAAPVPELAHFPAADGSSLAPAAPPDPVPYPAHLIRVEVGVTADIKNELMQQRDEMQLVIDEMKQIRDPLLIHEQRLNDMDSRPINESAGRVRRIAYVGRHRAQFLKIQADVSKRNFPISMFFVDCEKSPTKLFADYAIITSEVPHKWSFKITNDLGKDRYLMGSSSSERVISIIQMWMQEADSKPT